MTDEPDKAGKVRQPVAAALLVALLSCRPARSRRSSSARCAGSFRRSAESLNWLPHFQTKRS